MDWFKTHLQSISPSSHQRQPMLRRSLIMMGEIGGNDINFVFLQGKSFPLAYSLVPDVVQVIKNAIQETIEEGAVHIVVPGNFPIGCIPVYQTIYATNDTSMYDDLKCLKNFNLLVQFQNRKIKEAIRELKEKNPCVIIAYADFYNAYRWLNRNAASLGLEEDQVFNPCCGSLAIGCGVSRAQLCDNPKTRISWDGLHPTQQANKYMTQWLLPRIFAN